MIAPGRLSLAALCCPVWLLSPRSWRSRLRLSPFLPHRKGLCLAESAVTEEGITLRRFVAHRTARRPSCQRRAHRSYGRYDRTIADLPCGGTTGRLRVRVRRFVCRVAACPQRICAERLPQLVGRYARPAHRLRDALQPLGLALGGAAGARLATVPGLQAGQTTLLGLIRRIFPHDHAVIACLAGRPGQGSHN